MVKNCWIPNFVISFAKVRFFQIPAGPGFRHQLSSFQ